MKKCVSFVLLFIFLCSCSGRAEMPHAYKKILRVSDGKLVPFEVMVADLRKVDIVFIGESHDREEDHQAELAIIRGLVEKGAKTGIGLEMFRADSQAALDGWTSGALDQHAFIRSYYNNWRIPWPFYKNIFLYVRGKGLPMVGLNVPDKVAQKVAEKGFGSLSPEELAKLPRGISCDVDPAYMDFIEHAYEAHGMKKKPFVFFCEAQMLWNKAMAWHLVNYMKNNPGMKMIVLSGAGHSWKRGLPEQVKRTASYSFRVVLPLVGDKIRSGVVSTGDADYILFG